MHNIVLTSQNISTPAGVEVHGIFPSHQAAAKHLGKDHQLNDHQIDSIIFTWSTKAQKHEFVLRDKDNNEIYWCASVQPLRTEEGI